MSGFIRDTYLEFADRKKIVIFLGATIFVCLITVLSGQFNILSTVENADGLGAEQFNDQFNIIKLNVFNFYLLFLIILTLLSSVSIFPKRLMKGTAEYYLARPISRPSLFIKQIVGVIVVYGSVMIISALIVFGVVAMVHGAFDGILLLLILNLVSYLIWLSVAIFAAITFGSTATAYISMFFVWVIQLILSYHESIKQMIDSKIIKSVIDTLYYIFPKTSEFSDLSLNLALGKPVVSYIPLYSSVIFSLILLIFTVIIFKRKNY
jgi:ABC-type transport system involved in multi-copper enzyme maturation permease subunit